jgi:hypothetical protein
MDTSATFRGELAPLARFLGAGGRVAIQAGRLRILSTGNAEASSRGISLHALDLVSDVSRSLGMLALQYQGYRTGRFDKGRAPGVYLSFMDVSTGEIFYTIFNASLVRERRSSKGRKGDPLPHGHFSPPPAGAFMSFWKRTGLKLPRSRTSFHDYMGNLRPIFFTATTDNAPYRLDKGTICPLVVDESAINKLHLGGDSPDSCRIAHGQTADSSRISIPDKRSPRAQCLRGTQEIVTTEACYRGLRLNGSVETRGVSIVPTPGKTRPQDQTCEEWLEDYGCDDLQMQADCRIIE